MVRARLAMSEELARLERARADITVLLEQLAFVKAKIRAPHLCHICGAKTREGD